LTQFRDAEGAAGPSQDEDLRPAQAGDDPGPEAGANGSSSPVTRSMATTELLSAGEAPDTTAIPAPTTSGTPDSPAEPSQNTAAPSSSAGPPETPATASETPSASTSATSGTLDTAGASDLAGSPETPAASAIFGAADGSGSVASESAGSRDALGDFSTADGSDGSEPDGSPEAPATSGIFGAADRSGSSASESAGSPEAPAALGGFGTAGASEPAESPGAHNASGSLGVSRTSAADAPDGGGAPHTWPPPPVRSPSADPLPSSGSAEAAADGGSSSATPLDSPADSAASPADAPPAPFPADAPTLGVAMPRKAASATPSAAPTGASAAAAPAFPADAPTRPGVAGAGSRAATSASTGGKPRIVGPGTAPGAFGGGAAGSLGSPSAPAGVEPGTSGPGGSGPAGGGRGGWGGSGGGGVPPSGGEASAPEYSPLAALLGMLRETLTVVVIALGLSLLIKTFLVQAFYIPSESMENTLLVGDRVLVSKLTPGPFDLHRGDIVVFSDPGDWLDLPPRTPEGPIREGIHDALTFVGLLPADSGDHLIKRVIGLPGDKVKCCDSKGRLTVNGKPVAEPYLFPDDSPSEEKFSVTVPEGRLWVMGDHRGVSQDSRFHREMADGTVAIDDVVGKAFVVVWPFDRAKLLRTPDAFDSVSSG
jgi:signal peptidase I